MTPFRQLALTSTSLLATISFHAAAATNYVQDGDFSLDPKGKSSSYRTVEFPTATHGYFNSNPYSDPAYYSSFIPPATPGGTKTFWESQRTGAGYNNATYYPGKLSRTSRSGTNTR